jgi:PHP family Zn ribbon phosphoesterase
MIQHPDLNVLLGEYSWCLHCQRVHKTTAWQEKGWKCPACGGSALDLWDRRHVRAMNPAFPEAPEEGALFPIHVPVSNEE